MARWFKCNNRQCENFGKEMSKRVNWTQTSNCVICRKQMQEVRTEPQFNRAEGNDRAWERPD